MDHFFQHVIKIKKITDHLTPRNPDPNWPLFSFAGSKSLAPNLRPRKLHLSCWKMEAPDGVDVWISYSKWGYSIQLCDRLPEGNIYFGEKHVANSRHLV